MKISKLSVYTNTLIITMTNGGDLDIEDVKDAIYKQISKNADIYIEYYGYEIKLNERLICDVNQIIVFLSLIKDINKI